MAQAATKPTYSIRVTPVHGAEVVRVVELRADQGLRELATVVTTEFGEDDRAPWAFYMSARPLERATTYERAARGKTARLSGLELAPGARFWFAIQGGAEQWFRCELAAVGAVEPRVKYPRVTERVGEPAGPLADFGFLLGGAKGPGALEDDEELLEPGEAGEAQEGGEEPLVMDDLTRALARKVATAVREYDKHFEREDAAEAPRPKASVTRDLALAGTLCERFADRPTQYEEFVNEVGEDVDGWLEMLPFDLEEQGQGADAIALAERLTDLLDPADMGCTRARLLLDAGRKEEALAACEVVLADFPDQYDVRLRSAQVCLEAGELVRAEDLARSVYDQDLELDEALHYVDAVEVLAEVLRKTGRDAEAAEVEHSEKAERGRSVDPDTADPEAMLGMLDEMLGFGSGGRGGNDDDDDDDDRDDEGELGPDAAIEVEGEIEPAAPPASPGPARPSRGTPKRSK
jgi:tetratricopeptide (TPR) repeat protein